MRSATAWTLAAAAWLLVPKCAVCLWAWAAAGGGAALAAGELCGSIPADSPLASAEARANLLPWLAAPVFLAAAIVTRGRSARTGPVMARVPASRFRPSPG